MTLFYVSEFMKDLVAINLIVKIMFQSQLCL